METPKCPHCEKPIDLVSAKELAEEFSISANALQHARERGNFPEPWVSFANRNVWLRDAITGYAKSRIRERTKQRVDELQKLLGDLPEAEREEALELLTSGSGSSGS